MCFHDICGWVVPFSLVRVLPKNSALFLMDEVKSESPPSEEVVSLIEGNLCVEFTQDYDSNTLIWQQIVGSTEECERALILVSTLHITHPLCRQMGDIHAFLNLICQR